MLTSHPPTSGSTKDVMVPAIRIPTLHLGQEKSEIIVPPASQYSNGDRDKGSGGSGSLPLGPEHRKPGSAVLWDGSQGVIVPPVTQ